MDTNVRYRNDYENYAPYKVYFRKSVKYQFSHERFVVPWQLEENKKEKTNSK
jgi:hypothetical protein